MQIDVLKKEDLSAIENAVLDESGRIIVHPTDFYKQFSRDLIRQFCHAHAFYLLPTAELIEFLDKILGKDKARTIEIGSGNGSLGRALKIKRTDSWMQAVPEIKAHYEAMMQPTIKYGSDVLKIDAEAAIKKFRPKIVLGSWITQKWRPGDEEGNILGPDENKFLKKIAIYIMIGNENIHGQKRILKNYRHDILESTHLVSRAADSSKDRIYIFYGKKNDSRR